VGTQVIEGPSALFFHRARGSGLDPTSSAKEIAHFFLSLFLLFRFVGYIVLVKGHFTLKLSIEWTRDSVAKRRVRSFKELKLNSTA
jgi:hypothetical protein